MDLFVSAFAELVTQVTPYIIVWRFGILIVNVLITVVTGGDRGKLTL